MVKTQVYVKVAHCLPLTNCSIFIHFFRLISMMLMMTAVTITTQQHFTFSSELDGLTTNK